MTTVDDLTTIHPDLGGTPVEHHRVAVIGAGFAGIGVAYKLLAAGYRDIVILERASQLGGVWRDNTYPGCQCDVPSYLYSYSFAPSPDWSRFFGRQAEIWQYLEDCADRFGVRPLIRFSTPVECAQWDDDAQRWRIRTPTGEMTSEVLIAAVGALSEPSLPELPGLTSFEGPVFHSAMWRHDVDLAGKRVAVVGTGASAIQFVPAIQPKVGKIFVFQRTPAWVIPRVDTSIGPKWRARYRRHPWLQCAVRLWVYWSREAFVPLFTRWPKLMAVPQALARRHLRKQVPDPALRAKLTPAFSLGCKRLLLSNEWYPAIQKPNVELVTDRIEEIRARSIVTADGAERDVDVVVLGTGFKVTAHPGFDYIVDADGRSLGDHWRATGMAAYKGTTAAGFPNLFIMTGPNTGLGHSSMIFMMESQFAYVVDALRTLDAEGAAAVDPLPEAQTAYNRDLQRRLARTVWNTGGCASWYLDEQGRNPTLWPRSTWAFRLATRRFDAKAYRILARKPAAAPAEV